MTTLYKRLNEVFKSTKISLDMILSGAMSVRPIDIEPKQITNQTPRLPQRYTHSSTTLYKQPKVKQPAPKLTVTSCTRIDRTHTVTTIPKQDITTKTKLKLL